MAALTRSVPNISPVLRLAWAEDALALASVAAENGWAENAAALREFAARMLPERYGRWASRGEVAS